MKELLIHTAKLFLDIIYPKYCAICKEKLKAQEYAICLSCTNNLSYLIPEIYNPNERIITIDKRYLGVLSIYSYYKASYTSKMIQALKYNHRKDIARFIVKSSVNKINFLKYNIDIVVAVPAELSRKIDRTYNQTYLIAKYLAKEIDIKEYYDDIILRKNNSHSQTKLEKQDREENTQNAFYLNMNKLKLLENKNVLLIDDVLTSGSTLSTNVNLLMKSKLKSLIIFVASVAI